MDLYRKHEQNIYIDAMPGETIEMVMAHIKTVSDIVNAGWHSDNLVYSIFNGCVITDEMTIEEATEKVLGSK